MLRLGAAALLLGVASAQLDCDPRAEPGQLPEDNDCVAWGCTLLAAGDPSDLHPRCVFPDGWGYMAQSTATGTDFVMRLVPTQSARQRWFSNATDYTAPDGLWDVDLTVANEGSSRLRLHFQPMVAGTEEVVERYEIPEEIVRLNPPSSGSSDPEYEVQISNAGGVFDLIVRRTAHDSVAEIFRSNLPGFTMEDQFLEISLRCPTEYVYGFGEHEHHTLKHSWEYMYLPMLTTPHAVVGYDENTHIYPALYGHHPFFMGFDTDGLAYGVLFWNSNAQEVYLQPDNILTFRSIGGLLDIRILTGPSPAEVFAQYHAMIGTPYFPPYWKRCRRTKPLKRMDKHCGKQTLSLTLYDDVRLIQQLEEVGLVKSPLCFCFGRRRR